MKDEKRDRWKGLPSLFHPSSLILHPSKNPSLPRNVKVLGLVSLANDVASEMVFPLLPTFLLTVLGGTLFSLGVIEGAADSLSSLLKLWSGAWSDRARRRKPIVVFGYGVAACVRPLTAVISLPWQLFAIRVSDRLGKGVRTSPRDALIAESTPSTARGRAFGFHQAMDHLGAAVGPLLAVAFLYVWPGNYRLLFALTLVPGLAVILLVVFGLRERTPDPLPSERVRLTLQPFDGNFRLFLLALFLFTLGNSSDAFLLVRVKELGIPEPDVWLPILWSGFHILKSSGNLLLGPAADRLGPRPLLLLGWFVYGFIYLAFASVTSLAAGVAAFLGYAVFYGLTEPAEKAFVAQLPGSHRKGLAYGWYNFAVGIGTLPANLLFGALYQWLGSVAAFGWGAGLALLAGILLLRVRTSKAQ